MFDGFLLRNNKNNYKTNTLFRINNLDKSYEKYEMQLEKGYFVEKLHFIDEKIFLVGAYDRVNDNDFIFETSIYEFDTNNSKRHVVHSSDTPLINSRNYYMFNNILVMSYRNEKNDEIMLFYDLIAKKIINEINLENHLVSSNGLFSNNYIHKDEKLFIFRSAPNSVHTLVLDYKNNNFEVSKTMRFEAPEHIDIHEVFVHDNQWYILLKNNVRRTTLFKYEKSNASLELLLDFELKKCAKNLFFYDINLK